MVKFFNASSTYFSSKPESSKNFYVMNDKINDNMKF